MRQFYSLISFAQQEHQPAAVFFEPLNSDLVVGKDPADFRPEAGGVVHLLPVAELVDHDVVEDLRRCKEQQTVEIQVSLGTAASPAGFLAADRYVPVVDSYQRREVRNALGDHQGGSLFEAAQLDICQRGNGISFLLFPAGQDLSPVLRDPVALFPNKPLDVALGTAYGSAHDHTAV